jgi:hypothetical protein
VGDPVLSYAVVDVGCIECGESTSVVSVCIDRERALKRLARYAAEKGETPDQVELVKRGWFVYFTGGKHVVEVLEVQG